jgi:hypothetical protein
MGVRRPGGVVSACFGMEAAAASCTFGVSQRCFTRLSDLPCQQEGQEGSESEGCAHVEGAWGEPWTAALVAGGRTG